MYNNAPQQPQQSPAPSKLNKFFGSVSKMVKDAVAGPVSVCVVLSVRY